jgi:MFS family permease
MKITRPRHVLAVCLFSIFSGNFTLIIITVALEEMAADLHSTTSGVAWAVTGSLLVLAVFAPPVGRGGDLFGHRRLMIFALGTSAVFALCTALAPNVALLIAFRCLQVLTGGSTTTLSTALLFHVYPVERRSHVASWANGAAASATVVGLGLGGPVIDAVSWRWVFVMQALLCIVAMFLAAGLQEVPRDEGGSLDLAGATTLAAGVFALAFAVNRLPSWGIGDIRVIGSAAASIPVLWGFIQIENRSASPLLEPAILRSRAVAVPLVSAFFMMFGSMGMAVTAPLYMQNVLGYSATLTSAIILTRPFSGATASMIGGPLIVRFGVRVGALAGAIAGLLYAVTFSLGAQISSSVLIVLGLILGGFNYGLFLPAAQTELSHALGPTRYGLGAAGLQMAQVGQVFGVSLMTSIAADAHTKGPYVHAYLFAVGVSVLTLVATLMLPSTTSADDADREVIPALGNAVVPEKPIV